MSVAAKKLLQKVIQSASQTNDIKPIFFYILQIISSLQTLSITMEPLYLSHQNSSTSNSLNTPNQLAYYLHFVRILGHFGSGSGFILCIILVSLYLLWLLFLLVYCPLIKRVSILPNILSFALNVHSKAIFYCVHYFLIWSLNLQMNCSSGDKNCGTQFVVILILLALINFMLALFKDLMIYQLQRNKKDISNANNNVYPLVVLLHKTFVICLLYFVNNPKVGVIVVNALFNAMSLYLAMETFPFYNLRILRINVVFGTLAFSFSLLLIPEIKGSLDYSLFIILAVSSLFIKIALIRLDHTMKKVFVMQSRNVNAAIMLPSLLNEFTDKLNLLPRRREFNMETLFLSGFLQGEIEKFIKNDDDKDSKKGKSAKYYNNILNYFNQLRIKNPKNELLLLALAHIYIKKLKDVPRAIATLNYMRTLSPNLAVENAINQLSLLIHKTNTDKLEQSRAAYESYFEQKNRSLILKKEIQKEISEHINFWKLLLQNNINANTVCRKAIEISQLSKKNQRYWQIYFQGQEGMNFEFAVNYGYYLDVVQGLSFEGFKLIKNTYKALQNKAHDKIADNALDSKAGAILVVSVEPDMQGRILNICNSTNSFFEMKKGTLLGMDINTIIPKAFCAKHNEGMSKLYARSKLNMSQHPSSYVRTLDGQYFKAEVVVQFNSSMDLGLSFVVSVKRISTENESIIIVDSSNKVAEFSNDIGKILNLMGKDYPMIDSLCPDLLKSRTGTRVFKEFTLLKLKDKDMTLENEAAKHSETSPFTTSHRELLSSRTGKKEELLISPKSQASPFMFEEVLSPRINSTTHPSFFEVESKRGKTNEARLLRFNIMNLQKGEKRQKVEFRVVVEEMYAFRGTFYRILQLQNPQAVTQTLPQILLANRINTFADDFPIDQEKFEAMEENPDDPNLLGQQQLKPLSSVNSNDDLSSNTRSNTKDMEVHKEKKAKLNRIISMHKIQHKTNRKAESIASSQFSTKILAKSLISLFRENRINRLTKVTINTIYLTVFIVILTATIDTISTKASLRSMENAVNLVDLINKRLYKAVFAWQTALFIMINALGLRSNPIPGGGGGSPPPGSPGGPGGPAGPPPGGPGGLLSSFVKAAVSDAIENNNLLQAEVTKTQDNKVIETLYAKTIIMWNPEDNTASYFDSFRANEILAHENLVIANFDGIASDLKYEPDALSVLNNTANSYLIEVQDSIEDINNYFMRTRESNTKTLTTLFALKIVIIVVLFLFICKLFQNIFRSYKRLFKFVTRIPSATLICRINQLETLKPYFDAENTQLYESTNKRALEKHFNKDRASIDAGVAKPHLHHRAKEFTMRELVIFMLKYLILAFLLLIPAFTVFLISYKTFKSSFSELQEINQLMLVSYRVGTQAGMILPSFFFYQIFRNQSDYKIRDSAPLDQFYLSLNQLNQANQILIYQVLQAHDDDDGEIQSILTDKICTHVTSDSTLPCSDATGGDSQLGLLDMNSKYHLVAEQGMSNVLNGKSVTTALDPYSQVMKDVYQALAEHFLGHFHEAVHEDLSTSTTRFSINVSVILVLALIIRGLVLAKFKDVDIGIRKILRLIPYQIIEDQKAFMQYLKREFKDELEQTQGTTSGGGSGK